jgi:hypothetical protein
MMGVRVNGNNFLYKEDVRALTVGGHKMRMREWQLCNFSRGRNSLRDSRVFHNIERRERMWALHKSDVLVMTGAGTT